jgi:hypothetical protein
MGIFKPCLDRISRLMLEQLEQAEKQGVLVNVRYTEMKRNTLLKVCAESCPHWWLCCVSYSCPESSKGLGGLLLKTRLSRTIDLHSSPVRDPHCLSSFLLLYGK